MGLDQRHYLVIQRLLEGVARKAIAEEVGCHPTLVWQWQQIPDFQAELQRQRAALAETVESVIGSRLSVQASPSLDRIVQLRDGADSEKVRLAAAQDVLDRAGFKPTQKVHQVTEHILSPEFAALIREAIADQGEVIDVTDFTTNVLPERVT